MFAYIGTLKGFWRSHLINPSHFKSGKNHETISLTQIELTVAKKLQRVFISLYNFVPKAIHFIPNCPFDNELR